jgi:hypothetical protein
MIRSISLVSGFFILTTGTYLLYKLLKKNKNSVKENTDFIESQFHQNYECEITIFNEDNQDNKYNTIQHNIYKYSIPIGSFEDLQNVYENSLGYDNNIKECVDKTLGEYLNNNYVTQKKVIINADNWRTEITIETNVNPSILILDLKKVE